MATKTFSFAASSGAVATTFSEIGLTAEDAPPASTAMGDQIIAVTATATANGAAGVIDLVLVNGDVGGSINAGVTERITATVTVTARRTNYANSANDYVCTVAFPSGTNKMDLAGHGPLYNASSVKQQDRKWMIGCSDIGGLGTLTLYVTPIRAI